MAPGRLYRDYSTERRSFDLPSRDGPSQGSQRYTAILEDGSQSESSTTDCYRAGIGQTTDNATTTFSNAPDSDRSHGSSLEPVLLEAQVDDSDSHGSAAPAPAIPWHMRALSPYRAPASVTSEDVPSPSLHSTSSKRLPAFFSPSTFHAVLNNPTISHQFLKFAQSRLCGENLEFLAKVAHYRSLLGEVSKSVYEIHKDFISNKSPTQINLPETEHRKVNAEMKSSLITTLPSLENIFVDAQSHIEDLVYRDVYRNFVHHQMSVSAAKALGTDRSRYAGLGDCFVLTDPNKADNPILYASDGFVSVTQYERNEIIPRNCRFLQSRETDKAAVRRLKISLDERKESVELLLNRKKNGEPFWNLLYTTPLFDENGKLLFFLGGQINCSTAIHNASDVLRILAQSNESEQVERSGTSPAVARSTHAVKPSRSRTILRSLPFRKTTRDSVQPRAPGMEDALLNKIGDKILKDQMSTFYTAYSNYIIINYTSFLITFVSTGILDSLFPIKAKTAQQAQAIGSDVFKFLANHGTGSVGADFKGSVKGSLKAGQPISLDLTLCARPYMGFEKFVLHWTPLKDEQGAVQWIVLTLGNEQRVGLAR